MKPFKASLAAIGACLLVYFAFCFVQASFNISQWGDWRALCAWFMILIGLMAFAHVKSLE